MHTQNSIDFRFSFHFIITLKALNYKAIKYLPATVYFLSSLASLLLTPFGSAVVPPPMSLLKETFQSPVNQVCFGKKLNEAVVVSSDGTLYVLKISTDNAEPKANIQSLHVSR